MDTEENIETPIMFYIIKIISSVKIAYSFTKNSAVVFARRAGLLINASIVDTLFTNRFAISGASLKPLSFKGRSKSLPKKL